MICKWYQYEVYLETVVSGKPFKDLASLLLRGLPSCLTASFRQALAIYIY
jgi:hypothetical protein